MVVVNCECVIVSFLLAVTRLEETETGSCFVAPSGYAQNMLLVFCCAAASVSPDATDPGVVAV